MLLRPAVLAGGVLLVERELEVADGAVGPSGRYTEETLMETLDDLGVRANGPVIQAVGEMTRNGFVQVTDGGRLMARPALKAFKERLDADFPRMQGLNLVAYLVQTVDEVMSGRKGLDVALDQFGQTLKLQKADSSSAGQKHGAVSIKNEPLDREQKRAKAQTLKSALTRRLRQRENGSRPVGHVRSGDPVVFSAGGQSKPAQIKAVLPSGPKTSSEEGKEPGRKREKRERRAPDPLSASGHEFAGETPSEPAPRREEDMIPTPGEKREIPKTAPPAFPEARFGSPTLNEPTADSSEGGENGQGDEEVLAGPERESVREKDPVEIEDDSVPRRSLWTTGKEAGSVVTTGHPGPFHTKREKTVSPSPEDPSVLSCPVCDTGRIREQQTEKAQSYFTCSNPDCVFVSWGRPYARVCPSCGNPYLVEATGKGGESVMTCPRATCRHCQPMSSRGRTDPPASFEAAATSPSGSPIPGAKKTTRSVKRVVRRRVIRKKR